MRGNTVAPSPSVAEAPHEPRVPVSLTPLRPSCSARPRLLYQGFRWDTATHNAVCDLDAVTVFFDDNVRYENILGVYVVGAAGGLKIIGMYVLETKRLYSSVTKRGVTETVINIWMHCL